MTNIVAVNAAYAKERAAWAARGRPGEDLDAEQGHAAWLAAVESANREVSEHPLAAAGANPDPSGEDAPS
ncbi:MAG: hypothetical protein ABIU07_05915 [Ramlibacter sp.]